MPGWTQYDTNFRDGVLLRRFCLFVLARDVLFLFSLSSLIYSSSNWFIVPRLIPFCRVSSRSVCSPSICAYRKVNEINTFWGKKFSFLFFSSSSQFRCDESTWKSNGRRADEHQSVAQVPPLVPTNHVSGERTRMSTRAGKKSRRETNK